MIETLLNHQYYNFELHEERSILKLDWTEETINMTDQDFKDCLLEFAALAKKHQTKKLWVDSNRYKYNTANELMTWRKNTIIPLFQEAGVKQLAFQIGIGGKIMPASVTETGLRTECFETHDSTLNWLKNKN